MRQAEADRKGEGVACASQGGGAGEVTDLPARIGPAEFSILGGMIAVR